MAEEGNVDDDGERLVQQILAENPPDERGERDEWAAHVGWHRREDTRTHALNTDAESTHYAAAAKDDDPLEPDADGYPQLDIDTKQRMTDENGVTKINENGSKAAAQKQIVPDRITIAPQQLRGAKATHLLVHGSRTKKPLVGLIFVILIFVACATFLQRRIPKRTKDML